MATKRVLDWTASQSVLEVPGIRPHDATKIILLWRGPTETWRRYPVKEFPEGTLSALDKETESRLLLEYNQEKTRCNTGEDSWGTWSRASENLLRKRAATIAGVKDGEGFTLEDARYTGRGFLQEIKVMIEKPNDEDYKLLNAWKLANEIIKAKTVKNANK